MQFSLTLTDVDDNIYYDAVTTAAMLLLFLLLLRYERCVNFSSAMQKYAIRLIQSSDESVISGFCFTTTAAGENLDGDDDVSNVDTNVCKSMNESIKDSEPFECM